MAVKKKRKNLLFLAKKEQQFREKQASQKPKDFRDRAAQTYKFVHLNNFVFWQILLAIIAGVYSGTLTGLIPGIHVNLITAITVSSVSLLVFNPFIVAVFIVSLALTHSFLDSIPSIYLGAPDESQVVAALPGHQLLLEGKGHHAVLYTLIGSLGALLLTLLMVPYGLVFLEPLSEVISPYISWILIVVVIMLLVLSRKFFLNLFFFLLAGLLGFLIFDLPSQHHILLPLLSGLFGVSTLLLSLQETSSLPKQDLKSKVELKLSDVEHTVSRSTIVGMLALFLPGFGSSQAAIVASATMTKKTPIQYLLLVGGINTVNFAFSLVTMMVLLKARNGAIVGVKQLVGELELEQLLVLLCVLLIVGGVAVVLGMWLSKQFAKFMMKVNYQKLIISVISLLVLVVVLSKLQGLLILFVATSLGLLANYYGAQKNMLLGCLLLPVIFYLW